MTCECVLLQGLDLFCSEMLLCRPRFAASVYLSYCCLSTVFKLGPLTNTSSSFLPALPLYLFSFSSLDPRDDCDVVKIPVDQEQGGYNPSLRLALLTNKFALYPTKRPASVY